MEAYHTQFPTSTFTKHQAKVIFPPRPHCYGNYPRASESTVKSYVKLVRVCVCVCVHVCVRVCVCVCMHDSPFLPDNALESSDH